MNSALTLDAQDIPVKFSSLYLLVFKESGVFKIGKANDVYTRSIALQKWLGSASYDESFNLSGTEKTIFKLEKALHFFMDEFRVEFDHGDGKTELFELDSLGIALDYLKLYGNSSSIPIVVNKGIGVSSKKPSLIKIKSAYKNSKKLFVYNCNYNKRKLNFIDDENSAILLRSSIFTIKNIRRRDNNILNSESQSCFGEWVINQSGETLGQDDLDLLLVMTFMADSYDDVTVKFTRNLLISNLGWTRHSLSYERLNASVKRLMETEIEVLGNEYFKGTLLKSCSMDQQKCIVELSPAVTSMIMPNNYGIEDLTLRLTLNSTKKWLHSYIMSFNNIIPLIDIKMYHKLTGSNIQAIKAFKSELKKCLDAFINMGILETAWIDLQNDMVHMKKMK